MAFDVKIVGAGSIGNHLAHACRQMDWNVTIVDVDSDALERTRNLIYPGRYGAWDSKISVAEASEVEGVHFDLVIVGTPPDTHLAVATAEVSSSKPKVMLIEKPLAHPDRDAVTKFLHHVSENTTRVLVGYNQRLKPNTQKFLEAAAEVNLGSLLSLSARMLESWDGILKAHSWLKSETDSYLASTERGGGSLLEHSHALNLFLHFADQLGQGTPESVLAEMVWEKHDFGRYDSSTLLRLRMSSGLDATVHQDVRTWPADKSAEAIFENGRLTWVMGETSDEVHLMRPSGEPRDSWIFPKTRPDDFLPEIAHVGRVLTGELQDSPISLESGVSVMEVVLAALSSAESGFREPVQRIMVG